MIGGDLGSATRRERFDAWWLVVGVAWRASRWRAALAIVITVLTNSWPPVWGLSIGWITDGIVSGDRSAAMSGVWLIVGWSAVSSVLGAFNFHLRMTVRELATHQIDVELVDLTAGIAGLEHLERPEYADRLEALHNQRLTLSGAFDALCWNLAGAVTIVASLGVLLRLDGLLVLLPLFGLPSVWVSARSTKRVELVRDELTPVLRMFRRLFDIAVSPVAGKELRVFGADAPLRDKHVQSSHHFERQWVTVTIRNGIEGIAAQVLFTAGFVAGIALLIRELAAGRSTVGEIAIAVTLAATIQQQVRQLVQMANWARTSAESARRYKWLVDHAASMAAVEAPADPAPLPDRLDTGIELRGVRFRYPGTDVDVLRDLDLTIPAGATVAIVGDNGAGKTTLVKLLARYYEPTAGTITVDGVDLARIPASEWRRSLSAGFQDFAKLEFIAGESVGAGDLPLIDDPCAQEAALERAAASDVLAALPEGLSTQLGKKFADGYELSGGQWQKVALGRAMMRTAPLLLLLDEPTASLDAETEHLLFERYAHAARSARARTGGITVLVSHRFSTVRAADLIVVIEHNGVAEVGTHDELMAAGGSYAELYELQAASYR